MKASKTASVILAAMAFFHICAAGAAFGDPDRQASSGLDMLFLPTAYGVMILYFPERESDEPAPARRGVMARVLDGDTYIVRHGGMTTKIRLYGVDAPEKGQRFGKEAAEFVEDMLLGSRVNLVPLGKDKFGRQASIVRSATGETLEEMLLVRGYAWVHPEFCKIPRCAAWKENERQAAHRGEGLWSDGDPLPPWIWRKVSKRRNGDAP
jgi:endonuclease YncB( thermonuclease family)